MRHPRALGNVSEKDRVNETYRETRKFLAVYRRLRRGTQIEKAPSAVEFVMSLSSRIKTQEAIDAFFADKSEKARPMNTLAQKAKKGWEHPGALSMQEIQEICEALVRSEAARSKMSRSAA